MIAICKRHNWIVRGLRLPPNVGKGYKLQQGLHEAIRTRSLSALPPSCHHSSTINLCSSRSLPTTCLWHEIVIVLLPFCQQLNTILAVVCHHPTSFLPTFYRLYANIFFKSYCDHSTISHHIALHHPPTTFLLLSYHRSTNIHHHPANIHHRSTTILTIITTISLF